MSDLAETYCAKSCDSCGAPFKIKEKKILNKWNNVATSHSTNSLDNTLEKESLNYLLKTITTLLNEVIHKPYQINLTNIWKNYYKNKDFQETHIHPKSNFSFIISFLVFSINLAFNNFTLCSELLKFSSSNSLSNSGNCQRLHQNKNVIV